MAKKLDVKLIFNKVNGQINLSLPKRKISKKMLKDIHNSKSKKIQISIEKFYS